MRAVLLLVLLAGCPGEPLFGPPTGATCPPVQTASWDNFAAKFMTDYCTRCHDQHLMGDDRMGATSFHDFDTYYGTKAVADHVDLTTGSGPDATNTSMPPDGEMPTLEERQLLSQWLACGLPRTTLQECVDAAVQGSAELVPSITQCALDYPLVDFATAPDCVTFVTANLAAATATADDIQAACDAYVAQHAS